MKKINLTKERFAIVDDDMFAYLNQWKWTHDNTGYAIRSQYIKEKYKNGKSYFKKIYMHRLINQTPEGIETDHINRNRLDNRKRNLRNVSRLQNTRNTGAKGITFDNVNKKWRAKIGLNGKTIHLGRFLTAQQAIQARKLGEDTLWKN